ncbi:MAG: kinase-like domain-containing protein [Piptocephalis tieghemiana]|nr:MAG: kinase-like domain-containing protein [Piptocephalis tieghemiana]
MTSITWSGLMTTLGILAQLSCYLASPMTESTRKVDCSRFAPRPYTKESEKWEKPVLPLLQDVASVYQGAEMYKVWGECAIQAVERAISSTPLEKGMISLGLEGKRPFFSSKVNSRITYSDAPLMGKGAFGTVSQGKWFHHHSPTSGIPVAIKVMRKDRINIRRFFHELRLQIESFALDPHGVAQPLDIVAKKEDWLIIMEKGDKSLYDAAYTGPSRAARTINTPQGKKMAVNEGWIKPIAKSLAKTLMTLNDNGIVHGDVKPENVICFGDPCKPKLIDFGHAQDMRDHDDHDSRIPYLEPEEQPTLGTYLFSSYYVVQLATGSDKYRRSHTFSRDMYSLAALIHDLMIPTERRGTNKKPQYTERVVKREGLPSEIKISNELLAFLSRALSRNQYIPLNWPLLEKTLKPWFSAPLP